MTEESVREEFRIVIDGETGLSGLEMPGRLDTRIWDWLRQGSELVLNLSTSGLAKAAETIKSELEDHLDGEWEVAEMSLTVSVPPAVNILIKKKVQEFSG